MSEFDFHPFRERSIHDYAQEKIRAGKRPKRNSINCFPKGLATKDYSILTIEDQTLGLKVGTIWFSVDSKAPRPTAYLWELMIAQEFRRRGYGMQALRLLEEKMKGSGVETISLQVFGHNYGARTLYLDFGHFTR